MQVIGRIWAIFFVALFLIIQGKAAPKKRVCVIGAGRAGLAAVKLVTDKIDSFELVAFERNSDVGGLWIYRDSPDLDEHGLYAHSGIYKHLRIILPKEYTVYPDYRKFEGEEDSKRVSHKLFLEYLRNYTDHFHLRKYIQFDTLVTKVYPNKETVGGYNDWRKTKWVVKTLNLNTNTTNSTNCDAVLVCNGHFSKPNIPKIPGFETFPGQVLHSRSYREPYDFINKTVIVLGGGDSGTDISLDISAYAKKVYLSHRDEEYPFLTETPANLKVTRGVVSVNGNDFTLQDNSTIVADTFIFCTGYLFDFPFLDERSGIVIDKKKVFSLYKDSVNVEHPSMAFVGLTATFFNYAELYYDQTTRFIKLLQGEQQLPSYEDMLENAKEFGNIIVED